MSAKEVDTYIRHRGAFYGTASAITEAIDELTALGYLGYIVCCHISATMDVVSELAQLALPKG
jgi:hypothetical protein